MKLCISILVSACVLLALAGTAHAQFAPTGTGNVSVNIGAEASIQIDTKDLTLTSVGTSFADYTGTTAFTYKIRTGSGSAGITLKVTTDFSGTGGPSVANPPTAGDTLAYTCTLSSPGTAATGTNATTTGDTSVGTFGANVSSAKTGNGGSVSWALTNDPSYRAGSYTAVVTFTIHAV
jgi:hypothetical protein